jgi:hypothetical protein
MRRNETRPARVTLWACRILATGCNDELLGWRWKDWTSFRFRAYEPET